jgi:hypothetical protein
VEPVFCIKNSSNKLNINDLHFQHVYQSVTANHPFCPLFGLKYRNSRPKRSLFRQFSQPFLSISNAFKSSSTALHALHRIPCKILKCDCPEDLDYLRLQFALNELTQEPINVRRVKHWADVRVLLRRFH